MRTKTKVKTMLFSQKTQLEAINRHWTGLWFPEKPTSVWEWAEKEVFLPPQASPRAGKYSSEFLPYVRKPMECWSDNKTRYIILKWSAQSSKTTAEIICLLYTMRYEKMNSLFMMPAEDDVKSKSETVLQPIIEHTPSLRRLKPKNKNKYKLLEMHMQNGVCNLIGGNSASKLASRTVGRVVTDEVNKLQKCLKSESDPLSLIFERAEWFALPKFMISSTPTIEGAHIDAWFRKGTQEYLYYPCVHCDVFFTAKFDKHVEWDKSTDERELSLEERAETARIKCPSCGGLMTDRHKPAMLKRSEWRITNPSAPMDTRSFHFNRIMSPISTLKKLVLQFLNAMERVKLGDTAELRNFVNSALAEEYVEESGRILSDEEAERLRQIGHFRGQVPDETFGLVAGIDTQQDGFYYIISAIGAMNKITVVQYGFVTSFEALQNIILGNYGGYEVSIGCMDGGGTKSKDEQLSRTEEVYRFCRDNLNHVIPCFGRDNIQNDYQFSPIDKPMHGSTIIGGMKRLVWNTVTFKDLLFSKMKVNRGADGSINFPEDCSEALIKATQSEYKNEKGSYTHRKHIENHYLDCLVLCAVASRITNMEHWSPKTVDLEKAKYREEPQDSTRPW